MGIIDALFYKYFGPVIVKEGSDADNYINKMKALSEKASGDLKTQIDEQIQYAEFGLLGEKQITYELRNSGMDMLVVHDLYLEKNGLSAQIDFMVITRKHVFIIECKNLYGDIEIDDKGNFIRHIRFGKSYRKEGFVSPVSQNERHLNVIKEIRREYKTNFIARGEFDKYFPQIYRSIVVLANPKTVLTDKKAPKTIRDVVIRYDQLVAHIKRIEEQDDLYKCSQNEMQELLDSFTKCSKSNQSDYAKKYEILLAQMNDPSGNKDQKPPQNSEPQDAKSATKNPERVCPRCGSPLVLRTAQKGEKAGNRFWGCTGYPKCKFIENVDGNSEGDVQESAVDQDSPKADTSSASTERTCPRCGKPLVWRTAQKGENAGNHFWGCSGYPKCRFIDNDVNGNK